MNRMSPPRYVCVALWHVSANLPVSVKCNFKGYNLSAFLFIYAIGFHSPSSISFHLSTEITSERRVLTMFAGAEDMAAKCEG